MTNKEPLFETSETVGSIEPAKPQADYSNWQSEILPPNGSKPELIVDYERVDEVLGALMCEYEANEFPYNIDSVRLPQDARHMPQTLPRGGVEHANFFWHVCYYMRGGIKSVDAVKRMGALYDSRPDLFDPRVAADTGEEDIAAALKEHGLGFQGSISKIWVDNAKRLRDRWDGDPRKIFADAGDYETCLERVKNDGKGGGFRGFQEKMTSMILYYLMDEELIEPFVFPVPVDLHVMRVSIANGLIRFSDTPHGTDLYSSEMLATLRQIYYDYAVKHNVNPLRLCDAVWLLSESVCATHPGNITLEPQGRAERKGRSTVLIPMPFDREDERTRQKYADNCGRCALEQTCEFNIPGKLYYVAGALVIRGPREKLPPPSQETLI